MTDTSLRQMLAQTLDDYRLSRNERRALRDNLEDFIRDEASQRKCHQTAFELARGEIDAVNSNAVLEWLEDVSRVIRQAAAPEDTQTDVDVIFSPGDHCWQRIAGLLKSARQTVDICVFTITDDRITSAILDAYSRKRLLTGSYNWTRSAASSNEENFIIVDDVRLRAAFQDEFDRLWKEFSTY